MEFDWEPYRKQLNQAKILYLGVKVIPKARKTEFSEVLVSPEGENLLKIKVAAVPEKGKANAELLRFLAEMLGVRKSQISLVQGQKNHLKIIKVLL